MPGTIVSDRQRRFFGAIAGGAKPMKGGSKLTPAKARKVLRDNRGTMHNLPETSRSTKRGVRRVSTRGRR
jgi:hypothetical protein